MTTRHTTLSFRTGIQAIQRWDAALLAAASQVERRGMTALMRALTRAGDTGGWVVHGLLLTALLRINHGVLLRMLAAGLLATASSQLAKRLFRRSRPGASIPGFAPRVLEPDPFSFPSGHSTVAFAIATAALAGNPVLGGVELALAAGIASSRILLGAHYPADVLGGMALGLACGIASGFVGA